MEEVQAKVAQFVKARRKEKGMTQSELSKAAGIGRRSLNSLEKGEYVHLITINKVLAVFEYEARYTGIEIFKP